MSWDKQPQPAHVQNNPGIAWQTTGQGVPGMLGFPPYSSSNHGHATSGPASSTSFLPPPPPLVRHQNSGAVHSFNIPNGPGSFPPNSSSSSYPLSSTALQHGAANQLPVLRQPPPQGSIPSMVNNPPPGINRFPQPTQQHQQQQLQQLHHQQQLQQQQRQQQQQQRQQQQQWQQQQQQLQQHQQRQQQQQQQINRFPFASQQQATRPHSPQDQIRMNLYQKAASFPSSTPNTYSSSLNVPVSAHSAPYRETIRTPPGQVPPAQQTFQPRINPPPVQQAKPQTPPGAFHPGPAHSQTGQLYQHDSSHPGLINYRGACPNVTVQQVPQAHTPLTQMFPQMSANPRQQHPPRAPVPPIVSSQGGQGQMGPLPPPPPYQPRVSAPASAMTSQPHSQPGFNQFSRPPVRSEPQPTQRTPPSIPDMDEAAMRVLTSFAMAQMRKEKPGSTPPTPPASFTPSPVMSVPQPTATKSPAQTIDDTSLIRSTFVVPKATSTQEHEICDKAMMGRWYAQPSSSMDQEASARKPSRPEVKPTYTIVTQSVPVNSLPTSSSVSVNSLPLNRGPVQPRPVSFTTGSSTVPHPGHSTMVTQAVHRPGSHGVPAALPAPRQDSDDFITPSYQSEQVIEYKVVDLLRYLKKFSGRYREGCSRQTQQETHVADSADKSEKTAQSHVSTTKPDSLISETQNIAKKTEKTVKPHVSIPVTKSVSLTSETINVSNKGDKTVLSPVSVSKPVNLTSEPRTATDKGEKTVPSYVRGTKPGSLTSQPSNLTDKYDDSFIPAYDFLTETSRRVTAELLEMDRQFTEQTHSIDSPLTIEAEQVKLRQALEIASIPKTFSTEPNSFNEPVVEFDNPEEYSGSYAGIGVAEPEAMDDSKENTVDYDIPFMEETSASSSKVSTGQKRKLDSTEIDDDGRHKKPRGGRGGRGSSRGKRGDSAHPRGRGRGRGRGGQSGKGVTPQTKMRGGTRGRGRGARGRGNGRGGSQSNKEDSSWQKSSVNSDTLPQDKLMVKIGFPRSKNKPSESKKKIFKNRTGTNKTAKSKKTSKQQEISDFMDTPKSQKESDSTNTSVSMITPDFTKTPDIKKTPDSKTVSSSKKSPDSKKSSDSKHGDSKNAQNSLKSPNSKKSLDFKTHSPQKSFDSDDNTGSNSNKDLNASTSKEADIMSKEIKSDHDSVSSEQSSPSISVVPVETIVISASYTMTWVRFHGKVTTRLITPKGNFFLIKEIFRRCFRIQATEKRNQMIRIQRIMRSVLKIKEIEIDPVMLPFVIQNLKERKVIKTVPETFMMISEADANAVFHHIYADQFCDNGSSCISVFYKESTGVCKPGGLPVVDNVDSIENQPKTESTTPSKDQHSDMEVEKVGVRGELECLEGSERLQAQHANNADSSDSNTSDTVKNQDEKSSPKRNIFDSIVSDVNSEGKSKDTVLDTSNIGKKGKKSPGPEALIDLCSDTEGDSYDSDATLPYVDGSARDKSLEYMEEDHSEYTVSDEAVKVSVVGDVGKFITNKNLNCNEAPEVVVLDSDESDTADTENQTSKHVTTPDSKDESDTSVHVNGKKLIPKQNESTVPAINSNPKFHLEKSIDLLKQITETISKETERVKADSNKSVASSGKVGPGSFTGNNCDVVIIDDCDENISPEIDKHNSSCHSNSVSTLGKSHTSGVDSKVSKGGGTSENLSEKSSDGEIDIEIKGRTGGTDNPFVSSCEIQGTNIVVFDKKVKQCIDKAKRTVDMDELADVCYEVLEFAKPLEDLTKKYLSEIDKFAIAPGSVVEAERKSLMRELPIEHDSFQQVLDQIERSSPLVIELDDPTEMDNGT